MSDTRKQLGFRIDADLYRKVRIAAAIKGITMTELFREAIEDKLRQLASRDLTEQEYRQDHA